MTKKKTVTSPRCRATNRAGQQCKKLAMLGGVVCRSHGGAAPQTRDRARERILAAADPAVTTILELMFNKKSPPIVRLQAARDLLDRAGLSPKSIVEVEVGIDPEVLAMVHAAREDERAGHARRALEAGAVVARDAMDGVIDAELADDDEPGGYVDFALDAVEV